jgi:hypothetical protein
MEIKEKVFSALQKAERSVESMPKASLREKVCQRHPFGKK